MALEAGGATRNKFRLRFSFRYPIVKVLSSRQNHSVNIETNNMLPQLKKLVKSTSLALVVFVMQALQLTTRKTIANIDCFYI